MDLKTPESREVSSNLWSNLDELTKNDQIKFVICSRTDYEWARSQLTERDLTSYCEVLFSPAWGLVDPSELAGWILQDRLPVRFQLQLHKLLWGDTPGK
jgi:7-carboxy-7-deazaguanine synthase